jgi:flagellar biosynthetic protein FlhB
MALENNIPVIEDPPLARALYRSVPEEQEIPEELYPAVATILAAIYRKRDTGPRRPARS